MSDGEGRLHQVKGESTPPGVTDGTIPLMCSMGNTEDLHVAIMDIVGGPLVGVARVPFFRG